MLAPHPPRASVALLFCLLLSGRARRRAIASLPPAALPAARRAPLLLFSAPCPEHFPRCPAPAARLAVRAPSRPGVDTCCLLSLRRLPSHAAGVGYLRPAGPPRSCRPCLCRRADERRLPAPARQLPRAGGAT